MFGLMQDRPLLISSLIEHAAHCHARTEVISRDPAGNIHRTNWQEVESRAGRMARALGRLGVRSGDRVATLAWNTHRHLELYYAVSGMGAICHTVNPRLFFEQIAYICQHAEDTVLCFDVGFAAVAGELQKLVPQLQHLIALGPRIPLPELEGAPSVLFYEELLEAEQDGYLWPEFDERSAASLCYTSGTTGNPKGVLYSHRSTLLHTYAAALPDCFDLSATDVIMPASSMYHANAWGVPYAATMVGAKLVLPGSRLDAASLTPLIQNEQVSHSFGVPTIWLAYAQHLEANNLKAGPLKRLVIGGAACPPALIETFKRDYDVDVVQLWGMTETSPLGVVGARKAGQPQLEGEALEAFRAKQGRPVFGVQLKIVDDMEADLPHDGVTSGNLMIRGWWIAERYFGMERTATRNGWFPTGDVATLDEDGFMRITDRSKDVIKSGGEWISSIDLENAAVGHPAVAEAAVIGIPHPKWDERPLLIVMLKPGATLERADILAFLATRVAKWWLPEDVIFVDEIPHTATGKIQKMELRQRYGGLRANAA